MIRIGIFLLARYKNAVEGYFVPSTAFFILGIAWELYGFTTFSKQSPQTPIWEHDKSL